MTSRIDLLKTVFYGVARILKKHPKAAVMTAIALAALWHTARSRNTNTPRPVRMLEAHTNTTQRRGAPSTTTANAMEDMSRVVAAPFTNVSPAFICLAIRHSKSQENHQLPNLPNEILKLITEFACPPPVSFQYYIKCINGNTITISSTYPANLSPENCIPNASIYDAAETYLRQKEIPFYKLKILLNSRVLDRKKSISPRVIARSCGLIGAWFTKMPLKSVVHNQVT